MEKTIEIPEGYEARIEGNKVILERKESKDERIRKEMIALVEAFGQGTYKDEMLAYLEKQKEQKPAEWSEEDEIGLNDALWAVQLARTIAKDENDMGNLWCAEKFLKSLRPQPKVEWSEKDEKMRCNTILSLQTLVDEGIHEGFVKEVKKEITWLKSLRPAWKPSEEQKKKLEGIPSVRIGL